MVNAILIAKIITLGYGIIIHLDTPSRSFAFLVIYPLVIMAFGVLIPVTQQKKLKLVFLMLSMAFTLVMPCFFPIMLLTIPILCLEGIYILRIKTLWGLLILAAVFPFSFIHGLYALHALVSGFCIALLVLIDREYRLEDLQKQIYTLSLENDRLHVKLSRGEALKQQLTYTAQLEERNKIAQEIHDKVGHSISGSLMQLEAVKLLAASDPHKASAMLDKVIEALRDGLESIRVTLRNMKPPSEQMGLNRIRLMLDDFKSQHGLQASLTYEGDISRLSPAVWKIFLENVTEGLTNVLRHSNATQVSVSLYIMNRMARLQLSDNGSVSGEFKKGLGLSGMEERLCSVDGKLLIDTSSGFSLTMLIPLKEEHYGHSASAG